MAFEQQGKSRDTTSAEGAVGSSEYVTAPLIDRAPLCGKPVSPTSLFAPSLYLDGVFLFVLPSDLQPLSQTLPVRSPERVNIKKMLIGHTANKLLNGNLGTLHLGKDLIY
jgi:hypothetical protein